MLFIYIDNLSQYTKIECFTNNTKSSQSRENLNINQYPELLKSDSGYECKEHT